MDSLTDQEISESFKRTKILSEENLRLLIHYNRQFFESSDSKLIIASFKEKLTSSFINNFEFFVRKLCNGIKFKQKLRKSRNIIIEIEELKKFESLYNYFLNEYQNFLFYFNTVLFSLNKIEKRVVPILNVKYEHITNLPPVVTIKDITDNFVGKVLHLDCLVKRTGGISHRVINKGYKDTQKGYKFIISQHKDNKTKIKDMIELRELDETIMQQCLKLTENYSSVDSGQFSINSYIENEYCSNLLPGAHINLLALVQKHDLHNKDKYSYQLSFRAIMISHDENKNRDLEGFSESEKFICQKIMKLPILWKSLENNLFQNIEGNLDIKRALILQMFTGDSKILSGGTLVRSNIHILLIGDAGLAKSQFLKRMVNITGGIFTSAAGSSGVGLTASVVKDEREGQWMIEGGSFVLADRSFLCLDEADKIKIQEISAIHEAMEQLTVSISKAGISASLNARTSVLAAANPKFSKFSDNESIISQINFPSTLLSRFDLIFALKSSDNVEHDNKILEKIFQNFTSSSKASSIIKNNNYYTTYDQIKDHIENGKLTLETGLLIIIKNSHLFRKLISYSKTLPTPDFSQEILIAAKQLYNSIKAKRKGLTVTYRQMESILRLTEAKCRARAGRYITREDFEFCSILFENATNTLYGDSEEVIDSNILETGLKKDDKLNLNLIHKFISNSAFRSKKEILKIFPHFSENDLDSLLSKLERLGMIYQTEKNKFASIK